MSQINDDKYSALKNLLDIAHGGEYTGPDQMSDLVAAWLTDVHGCDAPTVLDKYQQLFMQKGIPEGQFNDQWRMLLINSGVTPAQQLNDMNAEFYQNGAVIP